MGALSPLKLDKWQTASALRFQPSRPSCSGARFTLGRTHLGVAVAAMVPRAKNAVLLDEVDRGDEVRFTAEATAANPFLQSLPSQPKDGIP
jgi:hypothetical protein